MTCRLAGRAASMRSCAEADHAWMRAAAATVTTPEALHLVHTLKYGGFVSLAEPMAHVLAARVPGGWTEEVSVIVPVPLHRGRQRERGFNQAAALARHLGDVVGLPVDEGVLRRTRATGTQTRRGAQDRRGGAVSAAFALRDAAQVVPRAILLVDDVLTTGATMAACAEVLRGGGAQTVLGAAFAEAV